MSINNVTISGNLTRDPELRNTATSSVLAFSVAVNERVNDGGEWKDRPNYIDCVMFGKRADSLSRIMAKGAKVAVSGKLRWSQWEKDGQKRSKVEVVANEVELMAKKDQQPDVYDDDLPF